MQATNTSKHVSILHVKPGDILYEDVKKDDRILMRKGQVLTKRIIEILRKRQVQALCIEKVEHQQTVFLNEMTWNGIELKSLRESFFQTLFFNSKEGRYGNAMSTQDEHYLKGLFVGYMKEPALRKHYLLLKDFDTYTFTHAVDVFALATLFSKQMQMENIEDKALGYLFYDIGKLDTQKELLLKREPLTNIELEIIRHHTKKGEKYFEEMGIGHLSYFSTSHHEHVNGTGYPHGLKGDELSLELRILHLVDVYSAMTLERPYRRAITAAEAFRKMSLMGDEFDALLLHRFIEFIGIFPENARIRLSNGTDGIIQSVSPFQPLNPTIRVIQTGKFITLPKDKSVVIAQMLHYEVEVPKELYANLSDHVVRGERDAALNVFHQLKRHYTIDDWGTKIIVPLYQMLNVLKKINCMTTSDYEVATAILSNFTADTWHHLHDEAGIQPRTAILFQHQKTFVVNQLFECILYANKMHGVVIGEPSERANFPSIESVIAVGDFDDEYLRQHDIEYCLSETQLSDMLEKLSGKYVYEYTLDDLLSHFKALHV